MGVFSEIEYGSGMGFEVNFPRLHMEEEGCIEKIVRIGYQFTVFIDLEGG